jgi:hypothetical protein
MENRVIICIASEEYLGHYKQLYNSVNTHGSCDQILYFIGNNKPTWCSNVVNITDWFDQAPYKETLNKICSLRARVVLDAMEQGYEKVIFCGADVEFFDSIDSLFGILDYHDAFGTPHITKPLPEDGFNPTNAGISRTGHFNSDLVGFYDCYEVREFLKWQDNILKTQCVAHSGVFLDQTWLNFLPAFVPSVYWCRDERQNVAYWNFTQRNLKKIQGRWETNEGVLVSFQYSGLPLDNPKKISCHQNRYEASGDFLEFLTDYAKRVRSYGV